MSGGNTAGSWRISSRSCRYKEAETNELWGNEMTGPKDRDAKGQSGTLVELSNPNQDDAVMSCLVDAGFASSQLLAALWADYVDGKTRMYLYGEGNNEAEAVIFLNWDPLGTKPWPLQVCRLEADVFETGSSGQKVSEDRLWKSLDRELADKGMMMTTGYIVIHEAAGSSQGWNLPSSE